jgi:hypothetical protein
MDNIPLALHFLLELLKGIICIIVPSFLHAFSIPVHNNPHASTAATNPLPTAGPIFTAAPELVVGGAELDGLGELLPPCTFATATPLTPVAFLH